MKCPSANFEFAPSQDTTPDYYNDAKSYVEVAKVNLPYRHLYHPPFELYDLERDPCEQWNLVDDQEHID